MTVNLNDKDFHGVKDSESTVRTSVSATENLTGHPLGVAMDDGCLNEGVSGEIMVSGEVEDSTAEATDRALIGEGAIDDTACEGLERGNKVVDRDDNVEAELESNNNLADQSIPVVNVESTVGFLGAEVATNGNEVVVESTSASNVDMLSKEALSVAVSVSETLPADELAMSAMEVEIKGNSDENRATGDEVVIESTSASNMLSEEGLDVSISVSEALPANELATSAMEVEIQGNSDDNRATGVCDYEPGFSNHNVNERVSGEIMVTGEVEDSGEAHHGTDHTLIGEGAFVDTACKGLERGNNIVDRDDNVEAKLEFLDGGSNINLADPSIPIINVDSTVGFAGAEVSTNGDEVVIESTSASNVDMLSKEAQNVGISISEALPVDELAMSAMEVEIQGNSDENRANGVCDYEPGVSNQNVNEGNGMSLVVDLNQFVSEERDQKTGNEPKTEGVEVGELSGCVEKPLSVCLSDDTACLVNGTDIKGNKDVEQAIDVDQSRDFGKKTITSAAMKTDVYGNEHRTEKEGEFCISDLVWGKVRSHPWWPGQIFDPSDSSELGMKHYRKDSYLIAYFGDKTFAWNEDSSIKPFRMYFSQMEKQSSSEAFRHAVNCALDEVSRRVGFGLACPCLSEEVYTKIKSQLIVNAGIREESRRRNGGDDFSSTDCFKPMNLVQHLKIWALSPHVGADRLEFVISRAQVLAFNQWKGYYQLPEFNLLDGILEEEADILVSGKGKKIDEVAADAVLSMDDRQSLNRKSIIKDNSRKRKGHSGDALHRLKKERRISDLMSGSHSDLPKDEDEPVRKARRKSTSSFSGKRHKLFDLTSDDTEVKSRKRSVSPGSSKPFLKIGETISKVARQLAASNSFLKYDSPKSVGKSRSHKKPSNATLGPRPQDSEKLQQSKVIPLEFSCDERFSQLCLAARDPMGGYSFLLSIISLFSEFRNTFSLENSVLQKHKKSPEKVSGGKSGFKTEFSATTETSELAGAEDSYWTDRIVQGSSKEQVLFEPGTLNGQSPTLEPEEDPETSLRNNSELGTAVAVRDASLRRTMDHMEEKSELEHSPTALILNFTDFDSVPSGTNLNQIFRRFGPLNELDTEVMKKSKRAKVVFKRRSDAEAAFSSAGKFSIFGPSLVSYRLNYSPSPRKTLTSATKGRTNDATSAEGE